MLELPSHLLHACPLSHCVFSWLQSLMFYHSPMLPVLLLLYSLFGFNRDELLSCLVFLYTSLMRVSFAFGLLETTFASVLSSLAPCQLLRVLRRELKSICLFVPTVKGLRVNVVPSLVAGVRMVSSRPLLVILWFLLFSSSLDGRSFKFVQVLDQRRLSIKTSRDKRSSGKITSWRTLESK